MQNPTRRSGIRSVDAALVMMLVILTAGVLFGTGVYNALTSEQIADFSNVSFWFSKSGTGSDISDVFIASFTVSSVCIGAVYALGFFAFGQLPVFLVLGFRGMIAGAVLSQIYVGHSGSDLVRNLMIVIPGSVLSLYTLAICAKDSVRLSSRILTVTLSSERCQGLLDTSRRSSVRFIVFEAAAAVSALTDCIFTACLN